MKKREKETERKRESAFQSQVGKTVGMAGKINRLKWRIDFSQVQAKGRERGDCWVVGGL